MLVHSMRLRPNIKSVLGERPMFTGMRPLVTIIFIVTAQQTRYAEPMSIYCWPRVGDDGPTLNQHWFSMSCLLYDHNMLIIIHKVI